MKGEDEVRQSCLDCIFIMLRLWAYKFQPAVVRALKLAFVLRTMHLFLESSVDKLGEVLLYQSQ
jgi:hypothetical protein